MTKSSQLSLEQDVRDAALTSVLAEKALLDAKSNCDAGLNSPLF